MNDDDDIELDELFAAARDLRAPAGTEARGWARFEGALGGPGAATAASTKLAWLAPAAKLGGVVAVVLAIGVGLSGRSDPSPAKRAAATISPKTAPSVQAAPATPDATPASPPRPELPSPSTSTHADARTRATAAPRPSTPRSPATVEPVAPTEPTEPIAAPESEVVELQRPTTLSGAAADPPPASPTDALRLEAELLGRAWVAIREGRAAQTRALLAEHARTFPKGALVPERQACQLVAACIAGDHDALDRARRYLAEHHASHLAARVATGCGLRTP